MTSVPSHKHHWRYKNLTILTIGLIVGIVLYTSDAFKEVVLGLGSLSFLGAFIAGILYDTTFTVSISVAMLLLLAENMSYTPLIVLATIGAVVGDYLVFRFVKDGLMKELNEIAQNLGHEVGRKRVHYLKHLFHSRYFSWTLPVVAVIMVGSPLPNEIGIGILGATGIKTKYLLLISLIFNFLGLNFILLGSKIF